MYKYVERPKEVKAIQWKRNGDHPRVKRGDKGFFYIKTLDGPIRVLAGDYIVLDERGVLYPVTKDVFEKTYEPKGEKNENNEFNAQRGGSTKKPRGHR